VAARETVGRHANLALRPTHGSLTRPASDFANSIRYSPDLSPIEPGWSKLKSVLRAAEARTRETLEAALAPALAPALDSITPADARGWFNHCGYSFPD
jgi:transposase